MNFWNNLSKKTIATAKQAMPTQAKSGFFNNIAKNVATAKKAMPAQAKSGFWNNLSKNVATAKQVMPAQAKSSFFSNIAKNIATNKPIPAQTKQMLMKTMQQGKQLPAPIKQALAIKKMTSQINPTLPSNSILNKVSQLIKNTNPSIVKQASPIQRSYMPIDLPYETFTNKKTAMKIPATNFAMSTDADLVQPPVDGGTFNYYGK